MDFELSSQISRIELFKDEVIEDDLYIVMVDDGTNAFVLGCRCVLNRACNCVYSPY